jgi:hypothetical protein
MMTPTSALAVFVRTSLIAQYFYAVAMHDCDGYLHLWHSVRSYHDIAGVKGSRGRTWPVWPTKVHVTVGSPECLADCKRLMTVDARSPPDKTAQNLLQSKWREF